MKRRKKRQSNLFTILVLLLLGIGLGYALLTQDLTISGTSKVKGNTWDIHFDNVQINSESVALSTGDSAATINASDDTLVEYTVSLIKPGDFYEFTVDVVNAGTVDGMIGAITSKLNGTEISTTNVLPSYLDYSVAYDDASEIVNCQLLKAGISETYKVRLEYKKDIESNELPSSLQTYSFSFGVTYVQADSNAISIRDMLMQHDNDIDKAFGKNISRDSFESITTVNHINVPGNAITSWDVSEAQNGTVMAWYLDADNDSKYELYIGQVGGVIANVNSSYAFSYFRNIDSIDVNNLNTSYVKNMDQMFQATGYNSTVFTLDLGDNFDTSRVTNMNSMFGYTGYNSTAMTLDLGDNFDTSNVENMYRMFGSTGHYSRVMTLDLGDKFDTSRVTAMNQMFQDTGYESRVFTLDLGDKFDTSNVRNMNAMFWNTGVRSSVFTLDFGDKINTSNVTNMTYLFYYTGSASSSFEIDLSLFDFSNVTEYSNMFYGVKSSVKVWVKDATDQAWIIARRTNGSTSNVLIKS